MVDPPEQGALMTCLVQANYLILRFPHFSGFYGKEPTSWQLACYSSVYFLLELKLKLTGYFFAFISILLFKAVTRSIL